MKIFVKPNFKQLDGDVVLYSTAEFIAVEVRDESLYAKWIVEIDTEKIEKIELEIANRLIKELNALCDSKSQGAKIIIAGMQVSTEQMEEYQMVAKAVEREDVAWFADEAAVLGTTAQEEFDKAQQSKLGYEFAYDSFKKLIRIYRRWNTQNIMNRDFILSAQKTEQGKEIGVGLVGSPIEILTQIKEQVMQIISEGDSNV